MNRKQTLYVLIIALCSSLFCIKVAAQDVEMKQGAVWLDTDGNAINAHGGGILYYEGTYYWYGEYKKGKTVLPEWATWECYRTDVTGVSCYSSSDLKYWAFRGVVLSAAPMDATSDLYPANVLERPKVIYCPKTQKFVMWMHIDSADYAKAAVGIATSNSPIGPFVYQGSFRPQGMMSRDQTVFVDTDGKAYHFCSSMDNATMLISQLSDDYQSVTDRHSVTFEGKFREAPAVFKHDGRYYILTSGCSGWDPNEADLAVADSIMGSWHSLGNPCRGRDADKTFYAQSTFVLPIAGCDGKFVTMFDRWNKTNLETSSYVWLPIVVTNDAITIPWTENFNPTK